MEPTSAGNGSWKSCWWWTPLGLGVIPVWFAWHYGRWFPTGDLAVIVAGPLIRHLEGEPLWRLMFEPCGNGHYGFILPVHLLSVKLARWDLRFDALLVVGLAIFCAACFLALLRRDPLARRWSGWVLGFLGVAVMLSAQQMMNWMASIQTCYYLVVASVFLVLALWQSRLGLVTRVLLASFLSFYASFCFPNGVLTWVVTGALLLLEKPGGDGVTRSTLVRAWVLLAIFAVVAGYLFLHGLEIDFKNPDKRPLAVRIAADPVAFLLFFVQVMGLPAGNVWSGFASHDTKAMTAICLAVTGSLFLVSFLVAILLGCSREGIEWLRARRIWLALGLWGILSGVFISLARTGSGWSNPLEARYAAFTAPLTLAALILWAPSEVRWRRVVWLVLMGVTVFGWLGASLHGFSSARDYTLPLRRAAAAVMFRHVAPVPQWERLRGISLFTKERDAAQFIDIMDAQGWMRSPTLRSAEVKDSPLKTGSFARGGFASAEISAQGQFTLKAWAVDVRTRRAVDAMAVSLEMPGEPERWLGPCMTVFRSRPFNRLAKIDPSEERIGWQFDLDPGQGVDVKDRLASLTRPDAPSAVLRVYAIDLTRMESCVVGEGRIQARP